MTWPEYLAGCCRLNGHLTRLTFFETDVLAALLLADPDRFLPLDDLIERTWTANAQPLGARNTVRVIRDRLRRRGVVIESGQWRGLRIPAHARGRERQLLAA